MITVIVNIDLYRYEIHSLLKAFYPREDVKVLTEADAAGSRKYQQIAREPFLRVVFAEKNITLSFCDGSDQRAAPVPGDLPADRKSQELKTLLKHLLLLEKCTRHVITQILPFTLKAAVYKRDRFDKGQIVIEDTFRICIYIEKIPVIGESESKVSSCYLLNIDRINDTGPDSVIRKLRLNILDLHPRCDSLSYLLLIRKRNSVRVKCRHTVEDADAKLFAIVVSNADYPYECARSF